MVTIDLNTLREITFPTFHIPHRGRRGIMRLIPLCLGFLLLVSHGATAWAASAKAMALRQANALTAFTPPEKFLAGNFVADEMDPGFIFGAVKAFAASRKCPTAWLIESGDKNRPAGPGSRGYARGVYPLSGGGLPGPGGILCLHRPEWIDSPAMDRMAGKIPQEQDRRAVSAAKSKLDQACTAGCGVGAELRFIQKNGELVAKSPEAVLRQDLKFAPIYDLNQQKKISP